MRKPAIVKKLENPAFQKHLRSTQGPGPVKPDLQDYDRGADAHTIAQQTHQYRLAQLRKLYRLYQEWEMRQSCSNS
jgi:hypothetical protein